MGQMVGRIEGSLASKTREVVTLNAPSTSDQLTSGASAGQAVSQERSQAQPANISPTTPRDAVMGNDEPSMGLSLPPAATAPRTESRESCGTLSARRYRTCGS